MSVSRHEANLRGLPRDSGVVPCRLSLCLSEQVTQCQLHVSLGTRFCFRKKGHPAIPELETTQSACGCPKGAQCWERRRLLSGLQKPLCFG